MPPQGHNHLNSTPVRNLQPHTRFREAFSQTPVSPVEQAPASDDKNKHLKLLDRAAGIAYVILCCHRDTWDFIVGQAAGSSHFRLPGIAKERNHCLVEVKFSGRALIAILEALRKTTEEASKSDTNAGGKENEPDAGTERMAQQVYRRIRRGLKQVSGGKERQQPVRGGQWPDPVRILIDDRPVAETTKVPIA